ncbi:MAG: hypothetical protein WAV90_19300, partial [Gordonia amarae]
MLLALVRVVRTGVVRAAVPGDDRLRFDQLWLPANLIVAAVAVCVVTGVALARGSVSSRVIAVAAAAGLVFVGAVTLVLGVWNVHDIGFAAGAWPQPSVLLWTCASALLGCGAITVCATSISGHRHQVRAAVAAICAISLVAGAATVVAWPESAPDVSPAIATADMHDVRPGLPDAVSTSPEDIDNLTWLWRIVPVGPGFVSLGRRDGKQGRNDPGEPFPFGAREWARTSYSIRFTNGDDLTPRWWLQLPRDGWLSRVVVVPAASMIVATVTTEDGSNTYGIDPTAGTIRWSRSGELIGDPTTLERRTPDGLAPTARVYTASGLVGIDRLRRVVMAWSPETGADLWRHTVEPECTANSIADQKTWIALHLSCGGRIGRVRAFDIADGHRLGEWARTDTTRVFGDRCAPYMCVTRGPRNPAPGTVPVAGDDVVEEVVDPRTDTVVLTVPPGESVVCNIGDCVVSGRGQNAIRVVSVPG